MEIKYTYEDIISKLPDEIVFSILLWLDIKSLGFFSQVCRNWNRLANDDYLWLLKCRELFYNKQNKTLTQEKEIFYWNLNKKWKLIFKESKEDAKRTKITLEELCNFEWMFRFYHSYHIYFPKFYEDYTLLLDKRIMRWKFSHEGIQVERYPELKISRTSDWGWEMKNAFVIFNSIEKENINKPHQLSSSISYSNTSFFDNHMVFPILISLLYYNMNERDSNSTNNE
jgi:hypothetical protein